MSLSTQSLSPNLPPDTQREMLRRMLTIRRFEERASADYLAGKIYGVGHCYIGEEAVAVGAGAGLSAQMEGKGGVAVSFFGDGASNAGPFHECLNIAATWKLPMLYVCENNMYAAQTAAAATHALSDVAARAAGYGIPGVVVDGNDIFAVYQAANRAVERARSGGGPTLIECKTYRWRGHTERRGQPDPRDRAEGGGG